MEIKIPKINRKDFNFISVRTIFGHGKLGRTILVFLASFFVIFTILNAQAFYDRIAYNFISQEDEQPSNLELENLYKAKYGHSINAFSTPTPLAPVYPHIENSNPIAIIERGLDVIGKATISTPLPYPPVVAEPKNNPVIVIPNTNSGSNILTISKIKVQAPIIQFNSVNENKILASLKSGVVLYPGSALPGQAGTSVIIGHSSSTFPYTKYSAIFAGLNKLNVGDLISIRYNGQTYNYIIKDKKIGSSAQLSSSLVNNDLVLASCWPVWTDKNRIIITADFQLVLD